MENNFENGVTPEEEVQQPAEALQPEEVQQPVEAQKPAAAAPDFAEIMNKTAEKGKELLEKTGPVLEKVKNLPRKIWIAAGAAVVVVIALIVVLSMLGNTYKTPIKAAEKLLNSNSVEKIVDGVPSLLNGFGESEAKTILKTIKKSEQYEDVIEDAEDSFADLVEDLEDEYGKNYKVEIAIEDKEKLEREDVRDFRDNLRDVAELKDALDELDSDDYEDAADELGLSKSQVKKMVGELEDFCKMCKSADVDKGYELSLIVSIDGSEVDEPEEMELTVNVFKVDGRWVPDVFSLVQYVGLGGLASMLR